MSVGNSPAPIKKENAIFSSFVNLNGSKMRYTGRINKTIKPKTNLKPVNWNNNRKTNEKSPIIPR